ncbi:MAG: SHOCT-like domain-containing protein [Bacteroidales bacterium]
MSNKSIKQKKLEILDLLETGKITSEEALELLDSLSLYKELKTFKRELKSKPDSDSDEKFIELN